MEEEEEEDDEDGQDERGEKRTAERDADAEAPPAKQAKPEKTGNPSDVSFSLNHSADKDGPIALESLQKPYLRTSAGITMLHLKKYLVSKFPGKEGLTPDQIMLHCLDEECTNTTKVGKIAADIWKDVSKDVELYYHSI
eukprot:TRINITY_DN1073_c0_g1_i2.p2 TRINITY_DN1073_c0_g1~~TRINITY_DN1073_c0_g1_i2.p2  ORF type:complete len:139 (+),score=35.18 TRINITY_DN1073_c0_g1_i2:730-1146(+)